MAFWQQKVFERVGSERRCVGECRLSQQRKAASSMAPPSPLEQINGSRPAGGCCPFPGTTAEERRQAREAPDNANAPRATSRREGGLTEAGGGPPSENGQDARVSRADAAMDGPSGAVAPHATQKPPGGRLSEHSRHTLAVPPNASSLKGPWMALQALFTVSRRACGRRSCATADRGTRCVPTRR